MTSETPTEPEKPTEEETPKAREESPKASKLTETIENIKKSEKMETLYSYAKSNTMDTAAYVALIIGIVWQFFSWYGGLLIGAIFGFYFANEVNSLVRNSNDFIESQGMVRSLILGGTLLALFFASPGIFIGAALVVGAMQLFNQQKGE